ncbi:MAG TPA: CPXCG motif-containing cysteine-rich protein [Steroidobacteraceae bacterium]|nr:CPXCG motif-containing cysteine-rich protein [Steroidobacteraceae bacterium]
MTTGPGDQDIDAAYGLEPVIEPGDGDRRPGTPGGSEFHVVDCPYCGEPFETLIDLSAGSSSYVEDCQVCCQPIEFKVAVDHAGALESLETLRADA